MPSSDLKHHNVVLPNSVHLVAMKAGSDGCNLHLEATEDDKEEVTVSVAAAIKMNMNAAVMAVLFFSWL